VVHRQELEGDRRLAGAGAFLTTLIAFFWVEMGDKTQLATVALAARYESLVTVVLGTTLGMMIANIPAVWIGEALAHRINMKAMRWVAAGLFVLLGVLALFAPTTGIGIGRGIESTRLLSQTRIEMDDAFAYVRRRADPSTSGFTTLVGVPDA